MDGEDQFESEAAQWSEEHEEVGMDQDNDVMIEGDAGDGAEEEEQAAEECGEERPPDIEEVPDEFLGIAAPDKTNPEAPDEQGEAEEIEGEGEGEADGNGSGGSDEDGSEEVESENERQQRTADTEQKIVQRKILPEKKLKEGGEDGALDGNADEAVILPADEAQSVENEEHDVQNVETHESPALKGLPREPNNHEDLVHFESETVSGQQCELAKREVPILPRSDSDDSRRRWDSLVAETTELSGDLCEQLRLILQATVAAKMRGPFRTGKRLDMRRIIPFIASGFRKDKIWMRRVQPDQRNYQVLLAIDNSASMRDNTGELALQAACLITQALTLLGIGELALAKFGETTAIVHPFGQPWGDDAGTAMVEAFDFADDKTEVHELLAATISYLESVKKARAMQLCFIVSDGSFSYKDKVHELVVQAQLRELLIVFVIIDSQNRQDRASILDLKSFVTVDGRPVLRQYLDDFPFPFYVLIREPRSLPEKLADILRQWFDLANAE
jgi:midasin